MWADVSAIFDWFVERLSIKVGEKTNKITSLSGGNQQKVLLGRAFAQQPHILILNDPARGIDVETKRELYDHLRDFAAQGHSVVFLSSELEEFIGLCNRVVVVRHGSIFESFSADAIDPDRILEAMFGQRDGATAGGGSERPQHGQDAGSADPGDEGSERRGSVRSGPRRTQASSTSRTRDAAPGTGRGVSGASASWTATQSASDGRMTHPDGDDSGVGGSERAKAGRIRIVYSDE